MRPVEFSKADATILKLYFSSLTARRGNYMLCNIAEEKDILILSNTKPDEIVKYCNSSFGIHIVKIKNDQALRSINKLLRWLDLPSQDPHIVQITAVLSLLNKHKWNVEKIELLNNDDGVIYIMKDVKKKITKFPLCAPIHNFPAVKAIYKIKNAFHSLFDPSFFNKEKYVIKPIDSSGLADGVIFAELDLDDYKAKGNWDSVRVFLVDGAETISNKEFIKKRADIEFNYSLVTWLQDGCIEYLSYYDDKDITVISSRPCTRFYIDRRKGRSRDVRRRKK